MTKTCPHCNKSFQSDAPAEYKYCSVDCAEAAYREEEIRELWAASPHKHLKQYRTPISALVEQNPEAWKAGNSLGRVYCNLFLHGPEGVGKSALCKWLLACAIESGRRVELPTMVWLQAASLGYDSDRKTRSLYTAPLLLLDDIHDVCLDRRGYALVRTLIETRTDARKRTLVTTNLNPRDLSKHIDSVCGQGYGLQLLRRLAPVQNHEMGGRSYRQTLNENLKEELNESL